MIRNLMSNALKYTQNGRVLLGCRRRGRMLSVEIWDTGVGIAEDQLTAIFDEYHQIDNAARERSRGLGLGLSIVQRLGEILGHKVSVQSRPGRGSVFSIEAPRPESRPTPRSAAEDASPITAERPRTARSCWWRMTLTSETCLASCWPATATASRRPSMAPPPWPCWAPDVQARCPSNGLQSAGRDERPRRRRPGARGRRAVCRPRSSPATSPRTPLGNQLADCIHLSKPVKPAEVLQRVQGLLPEGAPAAFSAPGGRDHPACRRQADRVVVDDDEAVRSAIASVIEDDGMTVQGFSDAESFLRPTVRDGRLPADRRLSARHGWPRSPSGLDHGGYCLPAIMITGRSDVSMAVQAMKCGASDFIEKPIGRLELLASVARALEQARDTSATASWRTTAAAQIASLPRVSVKSWTWSWTGTRIRTSPRISASASERSRTIALRS